MLVELSSVELGEMVVLRPVCLSLVSWLVCLWAEVM